MSKKHFTLEEQEALKNNQYVENVSEKSITYTEKFKKIFFKEYQNGKGPSQIFREMGFDIEVLGRKRIKSTTTRVKNQSQRIAGFGDTRKNNSGRPSTKDLTVEEQLDWLKHRNALLEQENKFLKKVEQLERKAIRTTQHQSKNSN